MKPCFLIAAAVILLPLSCKKERIELTLPSTVKAVTPPACGKTIFTNCNALESVFVPAESVDAYKKADGWSSYASMIKAIEE